jgi:glucoamylase
MLPEQVWDAEPIPSRRLEPGRPTGSAMPLVWAHAEFIKLIVSRHLGHPVDRPRAVWRRYQGRRPTPGHAFWWLHAPISTFPAGARLAVALPRPAMVHWGSDGWQNASDEPTLDSGLSFHVASLDTALLPPDARVEFTWKWQETGAWHGRDFELAASPGSTAPPPAR